jgi:hypothetical protein
VLKALNKLESAESFNNLRMGLEPKYDFDAEHYREFKAWLVELAESRMTPTSLD